MGCRASADRRAARRCTSACPVPSHPPGWPSHTSPANLTAALSDPSCSEALPNRSVNSFVFSRTYCDLGANVFPLGEPLLAVGHHQSDQTTNATNNRQSILSPPYRSVGVSGAGDSGARRGQPNAHHNSNPKPTAPTSASSRTTDMFAKNRSRTGVLGSGSKIHPAGRRQTRSTTHRHSRLENRRDRLGMAPMRHQPRQPSLSPSRPMWISGVLRRAPAPSWRSPEALD